MMVAKMTCISAKMYKIDWHCKLPSKVKVCEGKGKSFKPCKSGMSIQNEDGLAAFWKFCEGSESIDQLALDLQRLEVRNRQLGRKGEVVCIDNCCQVGRKTKEVPGLEEALIKLDAFHWQCRWDSMLFDLKSEKTIVFRSLMRRALFVAEDHECERVKSKLQDKGKPATPRDVFKIAKAFVPPAEELEKRVVAVIHSVMEKDLEIDKERAANPLGAEKEKRFFKRGADALNTMANQMEHVRNGCLSDPSAEVVQIHRKNTTTGKVFSARSAGGNEVDNRHLNPLLDTPSVGLTRAEQTIWTHCDASNDRKRVNRLGEPPQEASR